MLPRIIAKSPERIETRIGNSVLLFCEIEAHPLADFNKTIKWIKGDVNSNDKFPVSTSQFDQSFVTNRTKINPLNEQRVNITLDLANITKKDTGRYSCIVEVPYDDDDVGSIFDNAKQVSGSSAVFVLHAPQVNLETVEAVGATEIFVNWTSNNGNSPILKYFVQYMKEGGSTYEYYKEVINGNRTSYVLENFQPNTTYYLRITAHNAIGSSPVYDHKTPIRTLAEDPIFVPVIEVKGMTTETITIGWHPPSASLLPYIQYYELTVATKANESKIIEEAVHPQNSRNLPYMFDNVSVRLTIYR